MFIKRRNFVTSYDWGEWISLQIVYWGVLVGDLFGLYIGFNVLIDKDFPVGAKVIFAIAYLLLSLVKYEFNLRNPTLHYNNTLDWIDDFFTVIFTGEIWLLNFLLFIASLAISTVTSGVYGWSWPIFILMLFGLSQTFGLHSFFLGIIVSLLGGIFYGVTSLFDFDSPKTKKERSQPRSIKEFRLAKVMKERSERKAKLKKAKKLESEEIKEIKRKESLLSVKTVSAAIENIEYLMTIEKSEFNRDILSDMLVLIKNYPEKAVLMNEQLYTLVPDLIKLTKASLTGNEYNSIREKKLAEVNNAIHTKYAKMKKLNAEVMNNLLDEALFD